MHKKASADVFRSGKFLINIEGIKLPGDIMYVSDLSYITTHFQKALTTALPPPTPHS